MKPLRWLLLLSLICSTSLAQRAPRIVPEFYADTRAIQPGEQDRSGRWWWEKDAPKECGIHCAIYTGGFEHELHALIGQNGHGTDHEKGDGRGNGNRS